MTGLRGELTFEYDTGVDHANFNKPIAVGARLDLRVYTAGDNSLVDSLKVTSSDPTVLEVERAHGHDFVLHARAAGRSLLTAHVEQEDGRVLKDEVWMRAAKAAHLELYHACSSTRDETMLAGRRIRIGFLLSAENGEPLIGRGVLPLDASPGVRIPETPTTQHSFHASVADPGEYELTSQLDASSWQLTAVAKEDIDGLDILFHPNWALEDQARGVRVQSMAGETPVCDAGLQLAAESLTPELCAIEPHEDEKNLAVLDAMKYGICRYAVWLEHAPDTRTELAMRVGKLPPNPDDDDDATAMASATDANARPFVRIDPWPNRSASGQSGEQSFWSHWLFILALVIGAQALLVPIWWWVMPRWLGQRRAGRHRGE